MPTAPMTTGGRFPDIRAVAGFVVVALGAIVVLHQGRDILVPVALAILIWFLIGAMADGAATSLRLGATPLWLKIASAAVVVVALVVVGRLLTASLVRIGGELDPSRSPLILRLLELGGRLGLPTGAGLDGLLRLYPLQDLLGAALSIARNLISDASLVFLYVLFLMVDERFFDAKMRALFPDEARRRRVRDQLGRIAAEARIYLWLMFVVSAGVGLVTFTVASIFGLEGAGFWGVLAFGLNFIPTIGSILAVAAPAAFALLVFEDAVALTALVACLAATQFVAGEIVVPRLMGERLNLSAVVILLALVGWGALWGPVGMFLGIPITVIAMLVCAEFPRGRIIAILLSKDGRLAGRPQSEAEEDAAPSAARRGS